ncbi:MAG: hypothetical protein RLY20_3163 [Verrucomicrobiota bacterium]|jgi:hypothetical protein
MADMFDPRAYVQSLLPKGAASPQALAALEPQLKQHGISLQRSSAGDVRGRIYLPNPGGYQYGNAVDLVGQWGQPWTWTERSESAPGANTPRRSLGSMLTTPSSPLLAGALPQSQPFEWLTPETAVDPSRFSLASILGVR